MGVVTPQTSRALGARSRNDPKFPEDDRVRGTVDGYGVTERPPSLAVAKQAA